MVESEASPRRRIRVLRSENEARNEPNVTLRDSRTVGYFACPTCKKLRTVSLTKRQKPYFICNECGVQVFFRGKEGIRRFREMMGTAEMPGGIRGLAPIMEYAEFLRKRRRQIRREKPILEKDQSLEVEEKLVENEIVRVRKLWETELREARRRLSGFDRAGDE